MPRKVFTVFNSAQISTAQSKIGSSSGLFASATSDYINTPAPDGDYRFGTQDFTIEFFARFNGALATEVFLGEYAGANRGWIVYYSASQLHFAYCKNDGDTSTDTGKTWVPIINTWYHIAIVNSGGTITWYVDGSSIGTLSLGTDSVNTPNSNGLYVGQEGNGTYFNGYLDELRISKGIARYTGNFTPTTVAFTPDNYTVLLMHFEGTNGSTNFLDSSINSNFLGLM